MKPQANHVRLKEMKKRFGINFRFLATDYSVCLSWMLGIITARVNPIFWARALASHYISKLFAQKEILISGGTLKLIPERLQLN
jgi:hypothetical protein